MVAFARRRIAAKRVDTVGAPGTWFGARRTYETRFCWRLPLYLVGMTDVASISSSMSLWASEGISTNVGGGVY